MRPDRRTGTRAGANKDSAVIARVGRARRAGRPGGAGRLAAKAAIAVVIAVAAAIVKEDILRIISIFTG